MVYHWLKISLRRITRRKFDFLIHTVGLTLGLSIFLMMSLYVIYERSYDSFIPDDENVYRVLRKAKSDNNYYKNPEPLASALRSELPEVHQTTRLLSESRDKLLTTGNSSFLEGNVKAIDPTGIDLFNINFLKGVEENFKPETIIISRSQANKMFGTTEVIGELIEVEGLENQSGFTVAGVFEDYPNNSHLDFDVVFHFDGYIKRSQPFSIGSWNNNYFDVYLSLKEHSNIEAINSKLPFVLDKYTSNKLENEGGQRVRLVLQNIREIHLDDKGVSFKPSNSSSQLSTIALLAFFILIIACANYANLSSAQSLDRALEVGIRKTSGAHKNSILFQFFSETFWTVSISLVFSLIIVYSTLPSFNSFMEREIPFGLFGSSKLVLLVLAVLTSTIFLAGYYPALVLSRYRPSVVLKGKFSRSGNGTIFRKTLVLIQFIISGLLIISALAIQNQISFVTNKEPGFDTDGIICFDIKDHEHKKLESRELLKERISKIPGVELASFSNSLPNEALGSMGRVLSDGSNENTLEFNVIICDSDFLKLYDIELKNGRNFSNSLSDKNNYLINEEGLKLLGLSKPVGKSFVESGKDTIEIIGVVENFHFKSFHEKIKPFRFISDKARPTLINYLSVKTIGDNTPLIAARIEEELNKISAKYPVEFSYFTDTYLQQYEEETKTANMVKFFTFFSILIACLGLLGLIQNNITVRMKELAIRKVLGATLQNIVLNLGRGFFPVVICGFAIGAAFAYYYIQNWLLNFAYRDSLDFYYYLISFGLVVTLIFAILIIQVVRNGNRNLSEVLRNE